MRPPRGGCAPRRTARTRSHRRVGAARDLARRPARSGPVPVPRSAGARRRRGGAVRRLRRRNLVPNVAVGHEMVRRWAFKFGQPSADLIRRRPPATGDRSLLRPGCGRHRPGPRNEVTRSPGSPCPPPFLAFWTVGGLAGQGRATRPRPRCAWRPRRGPCARMNRVGGLSVAQLVRDRGGSRRLVAAPTFAAEARGRAGAGTCPVPRTRPIRARGGDPRPGTETALAALRRGERASAARL